MEVQGSHRSTDNLFLVHVHSLKWKRPSVLEVVIICVYLTSLLFYIISISTNHWVWIDNDGSRVNMGLWSACMTDEVGVEPCSTEIHHLHLVKQDLDWRVPRGLVLTGLVVWFFYELLVITVCFTERSPGELEVLLGVNILLTASTASCLFLTLVIVGSHVSHIPHAALSWSFTMAVVTMATVICTCILTLVTYKTDQIRNCMSRQRKPT